MRIKKLVLNNFQGIKKLELDFDGKSCSIYGDNATGKTTIFNAFTWLLFDKASTGAKNYNPKTKGKNGDLHGLDHETELVCQLENGRIIKYRKLFKEVYTKKKGSAQEVFSGHTTDFFIDGVPVKEKDYNESIQANLGDPEKLKMLTMPFYVAEDMHWKGRRSLLLDVCGDISDDEVFSATNELKGLKELLVMPGTIDQYYDIETFQAKTSRAMAEINKSLTALPDRIDEAERAKPETSSVSEEEALAKIKELEERKMKVQQQKLEDINSDSLASKLKEMIREKDSELRGAERSHRNMLSERAANARIEELELAQPIKEIEIKISEANRHLSLAEKAKEKTEAQRLKLLEDYKKAAAIMWDKNNEICPSCERPLEPEDIEKAKENFNFTRSNALEKINEEGKNYSKEVISALELEIERHKTELSNLEIEREKHIAELDSFRNNKSKEHLFEETDEFKKLYEQLNNLKTQEIDKEKQLEAATSAYDEELDTLKKEISSYEEILSNHKQVERQEKRINDLMKEEESLSQRYQEEQRSLYLCELFIKQKVSMLDEKINSVFKNVRFQLFVDQINGGIKEDCEVLVPAEGGRLVPFSLANNARRINAGLEIVDTLAKHFKVSMPIFIDNAESVTRLYDTTSQIIRLVVSEQDKSLRLVIDK